MQTPEIVRGTLRVGGRGKYRALILFEDVKPIRQIRGVVVPDFGRDTKLGTEEGGPQLRDKFFEGIGVGTETLPEFPCAAGRVTGPVS